MVYTQVKLRRTTTRVVKRYGEMVKKLKEFKTLSGRTKAAKANPKLTAKQLDLARVNGEIEKLVESLKRQQALRFKTERRVSQMVVGHHREVTGLLHTKM